MGASSKKGKLVESIAAKLHACPGVKVQTNQKLPPWNGKGGPREIDVLLTSDNISGYTIRIAIECKNEEAPIEAEYIDAFIGKLSYVGIPSQNAVYISVSDYRSGAKERAEEAGIKLLNLTGLTKDRLESAVIEAFQSVLHLLLEVQAVSIYNNAETMRFPGFLFTENFVPITIHDPIWMSWLNGEVPPIIGQHKLDVTIPEGLFQEVDGKLVRPLSMTADVKVMGIMFTYRGKATQHTLVNACDKRIEKSNIAVQFDETASPESVVTVHSEEALAAQASNPADFQVVTGRYIMPRIVAFSRFGWCYWPPSEKTWEKFKTLVKTYGIEGEINPAILAANPLESRSVNAILDPIAKEYPLQRASIHPE